MRRVSKNDIMNATEFGKTVILHYFPQSSVGFASKRNFRLRSDDHKPSATVFFKENIWFLQDKGGADNKAYNAISLVMEREGLGYPQAIEWIAAKFAPHLLDESAVVPGKPKPDISPAEPSDSIVVSTRKDGFTEKELAVLGYKITADICKAFNLRPVDYYITKKNDKGKSFRISSTENYPIYYYDYGDWGKLYQPMGDIRFMYVGEKPAECIFGDNTFLKTFDAVKNGTLSTGSTSSGKDNYIDEAADDKRLDNLIICSGPSDALNTYAAGYNVCWPNSETEDIHFITFSRLLRCCRNLYIMYDIDDTGLSNMYRIALQYLDLKVIRLPEDLKAYKHKGKPCKDAKDFMMYYRSPDKNNPHKIFDSIVKTSTSLKWWSISSKDDEVKYDIDNEPLYKFLEANGFYRMVSPSDKKGYQFIHIRGNSVRVIEDERFSAEIKKFLRDYLAENSHYYHALLVKMLYRTRQLTLSSLENLPLRELDFKSYSKDEEWVFFRNTGVRVTPEGIDTVPSSACPFFVLDSKTIKHDFHAEKPFFELSRTEEWTAMTSEAERLRKTSGPRTPEYIGLKRRIDKMTGERKWRIKILRDDCTFMKYVYNTGRSHWRKEELGYPLEEAELAEEQLNFINKVMAIGYMLCKYKDASRPYAVYCMEMEEGENGEHNGGTGKSLFAKSIGQMRKQIFVSGQEYDPSNPRFMLQEVKKDETDMVFMDDLNTKVDLHRFMPMITGDMTVNPKYVPAFTLDFKESPKVVFTSNHAIRNFDASLRRRTFFCAFSDYYHAEKPELKLPERTPGSEFGKQLIHDYTPEEMNGFYNFMLQCMQIYMKYRERVQPPMKAIERRTLKNALGDDFIWWAEEYFSEERLDVEIDRQEAFDAYKEALSDGAGRLLKMRNFTDRLKLFCQYKGWELTPERLLTTQSEKDRGEIRRYVDGKHKYYFYISTKEDAEEAETGDSDAPPFEV